MLWYVPAYRLVRGLNLYNRDREHCQTSLHQSHYEAIRKQQQNGFNSVCNIKAKPVDTKVITKEHQNNNRVISGQLQSEHFYWSTVNQNFTRVRKPGDEEWTTNSLPTTHWLEGKKQGKTRATPKNGISLLSSCPFAPVRKGLKCGSKSGPNSNLLMTSF